MRTGYAIISKELAETNGIDITVRQSIHDGKDIIVTENDVKGLEDIKLLSREEVYREINNRVTDNKKKG